MRVTPPSPLRTAYRPILALRTAYRHFSVSRTAYRLTTKTTIFGVSIYMKKIKWPQTARAKRAREKNRDILLCMSRLLCFLMTTGPFERKKWCLRTILQDFCELRTDPLRSAYRLNTPWILRTKKGGVSPSHIKQYLSINKINSLIVYSRNRRFSYMRGRQNDVRDGC